MSNISSKALSSFKYGYLTIFFVLLSGIFYPLINDVSFSDVIIGIGVLFMSLIGCILVYKATTTENKSIIFFTCGFALITISLYLIFGLTGRI
tara:strand:- start:225 stop:503 length:279 start_codon:yes stop_codon:yes gene_type:complete